MGGNSSAGGLSNLFGGGSQSFDPTTGAPLGNIGDPTGGTFWANPSNPGVTQDQPTQAAQNTQAASSSTATGQQSGPGAPPWVQNLSNIFLGGQGSPAAQAGLTGGRGGATPAPEIGAAVATPAPGTATAAVPPVSTPVPVDTSATVSPQSAPVSGKTQAVPEVAPVAPAQEAAPAPTPAAPDTTNYPDVSGTSRESGMGPIGPTTVDTGVSASGTGIPPILQDLFSLNFGRFISDLLGQQGLPASQNQAAASRPSADTRDTGDTGTKTAQTPAQKAVGAVTAAGEALKPKPSSVDTTPTTATTPPVGAGAAGTATAAPTTPAGAPSGASATGQPTTGATAPATTAGPGGTNLMGTGFFDPQTTRERPAGAPPTPPAAPTAAAPPAVAPTTAGPVPTGAAGASRPQGREATTLAQPPGGQLTPDGGRAPTNGMPGGLTPNAPPPLPGLGAIPNQANRPRHYEGTLTMPDGTTYRYGTGGGQFASAPYGTYQVHPGAVGSIGKSIGAWAGYSDSSNPGNNTVHDPLYKGAGGTSARSGVEIHPDVSGRRLITNGCIGIDRGQSAAFGRSFKAAAAQGPLMMRIEPGGKATMFYASSPPAVAGQQPGNAAGIPSNENIDPRYGRAGVVHG